MTCHGARRDGTVKQIREYAWSWFSYQRPSAPTCSTTSCRRPPCRWPVRHGGGEWQPGAGHPDRAGGGGHQLLLHTAGHRNEERSASGSRRCGGGAGAVQCPEGRQAEGRARSSSSRASSFPRASRWRTAARTRERRLHGELPARQARVFLRLIEQTILDSRAGDRDRGDFPAADAEQGKPEVGKATQAQRADHSLKTTIDDSVANQQAAQDRLRASVSQTTTDLTARRMAWSRS